MAVFFIVVNEFCERFSYYGMRSIHAWLTRLTKIINSILQISAVLALYLNDILNYSEDESTVIYHVFVMLVMQNS